MTALLNSRRGRPRAVALAAAIVLVYALLLPAYGPLVSPTFAEFLPNHSHVHLDGDPAHLHGYETLDGTSSGFVALPSADDGSSAPGTVVPVAFVAVLALASAPIVMLLSARSLAQFGGISTRTATPPPRAAALS
ncbi:MAG: hypothetical protein F4185_04195 [Chloroflexi bacterium]|nr:hypothetical protein [Chloroflexota bacterium]MYF65132.1 hypothetical protein [Chloroflexota bacterium]MYK36031.1 hypothetical protein [Chloroflexota bacterium]